MLFDREGFRNYLLGLSAEATWRPTRNNRIQRIFQKLFLSAADSATLLTPPDMHQLVQRAANDTVFWDKFTDDVHQQIQDGSANSVVQEVGKIYHRVPDAGQFFPIV